MIRMVRRLAAILVAGIMLMAVTAATASAADTGGMLIFPTPDPLVSCASLSCDFVAFANYGDSMDLNCFTAGDRYFYVSWSSWPLTFGVSNKWFLTRDITRNSSWAFVQAHDVSYTTDPPHCPGTPWPSS